MRNLILSSMKIQHLSVKRFFVLESEFAIQASNKLLFYLSLLPKNISLLQIVSVDKILYQSQINLEKQIKMNCSSEVLTCYQVFLEYLSFLDQVANVAVSSNVHHQNSKSKIDESQPKKVLYLIDQLCFYIFEEVLLGFFQDAFVQSPSELDLNDQHLSEIRTAYQVFLKMAEKINNERLAATLFNFVFRPEQAPLKNPEDLFTQSENGSGKSSPESPLKDMDTFTL